MGDFLLLNKVLELKKKAEELEEHQPISHKSQNNNHNPIRT